MLQDSPSSLFEVHDETELELTSDRPWAKTKALCTIHDTDCINRKASEFFAHTKINVEKSHQRGSEYFKNTKFSLTTSGKWGKQPLFLPRCPSPPYASADLVPESNMFI
jgi:hypothetical protein